MIDEHFIYLAFVLICKTLIYTKITSHIQADAIVTEEQWRWLVHPSLFLIFRGCWALRQSHCSSLYHLFIIFTHTPVCLATPIRRWNASARMWRPVALSHKHHTSAASSHSPPHQTAEVITPCSDFQHVFLALLYKIWSSTKPPKRSARPHFL